jgi:Tol biopolymer transport system component
LLVGTSGSLAIRVLDLRTHQVSELPGSEGLYSPRWSPNGRYICALAADSKKLLLFDVTTQKWTQLADASVGYPSWSRNGEYIYLQSSFGDESAVTRVRVIDHKLEKLANLDGFQFTGPNYWFGLAPSDLPLLLRNVGTREIYVLDWDAP